jgi:hypothetical protein
MSRKFTQQEKDFIKQNYQILKMKDIAKQLNRSEGVIKGYIYTNKLSKPKVKPLDRFGKLTVKALIEITKRGRIWHCECDCGKITKCATNTLLSGHSCSCGCERLKAIATGYKIITGTWYGSIKKNAKTRGLEFTVSLEYLQNLWELQNGLCAISKLSIVIVAGRASKETTASLDRIDNNIGYRESNVQFLHKHVNCMKWTHTQDYFIELCKKIASNN